MKTPATKPINAPIFMTRRVMIAAAVFVLTAGMAVPVLGRISPFRPQVSAHDSRHIATAHSADAYDTLGYVRGPKRTIILFRTPLGIIFHVSIGDLIGMEQFRVASIRDDGGNFRVTLAKDVQDMHGKTETIYRYKSIMRE